MLPTCDAREKPWRACRRQPTAVAALAGVSWLQGRDSSGRCTAAAPLAVAESHSLWIADSALDDGRRMLVVIDPERKHAAIYHVDAMAGTLTLKSTRDIGWDLLIEDFNAQTPKPADLKRMLEAGGGASPSR